VVHAEEYLINGAILITIIYLTGLLHKQFLVNINQTLKDIMLMMIAIFAGWFSMFFGIHIDDSVIFDLRFIPVIIAALYAKNPIVIIVVGVGIGLARYTFGISEAATVGFINMAVLAIIGAALSMQLKKWTFYKKMFTITAVLNVLNTVVVAVFGVISVQDYLLVIMPIVFPMNVLLSLLLVWIVKDLYDEYLYKMDLVESARKDPLTQLYNRRAFMHFYNQYMSGKKGGSPFAIAFIDIDHFKKINDTYGHIVGDLVLQEVSKVISNSLRSIDIVSRYGGEEFVIILPECNKESANKAVERIRESLEIKAININGLDISITLSAGIAAASGMGSSHLLKQADDALYLAKNTGRNKVVCAGSA
jgi:diguanylate cyclase